MDRDCCLFVRLVVRCIGRPLCLSPHSGAQVLLQTLSLRRFWGHELAAALWEIGISECKVKQLLDSFGEVNSNMSSTDDVIVMNTHVANSSDAVPVRKAATRMSGRG